MRASVFNSLNYIRRAKSLSERNLFGAQSSGSTTTVPHINWHHALLLVRFLPSHHHHHHYHRCCCCEHIFIIIEYKLFAWFVVLYRARLYCITRVTVARPCTLYHMRWLFWYMTPQYSPPHAWFFINLFVFIFIYLIDSYTVRHDWDYPSRRLFLVTLWNQKFNNQR